MGRGSVGQVWGESGHSKCTYLHGLAGLVAHVLVLHGAQLVAVVGQPVVVDVVDGAEPLLHAAHLVRDRVRVRVRVRVSVRVRQP